MLETARWRLSVLEALAWLALASLSIRLVPFSRLAPLFGSPRAADEGGAEPSATHGPDPSQRAAARRIGRAVERAARLAPWSARCLPQAMAAKAMLACRGMHACLHLGAATIKDPPGLAAHAWLTLGPMTVVGGAGRGNYAELVRFG